MAAIDRRDEMGTRASSLKRRPRKNHTGRCAKGRRAIAIRHTRNISHTSRRIGPQGIISVRKKVLKKDLRHGRRWSILVNGFIADDGKTISGLGLGLLLLCGPATAKKMSYKHQCQEDLLTRVPDIILLDTTILI